MITNKGKDIIAKYLIGQAPGYASHISLGCGSIPLQTGDTLTSNPDKVSMDFEMLRTPIVSRGYVTELVTIAGIPTEVSKVVLTAEIPSEQRYRFTEVGVYSAGSNPSAVGKDSRIIYTFTEAEAWEYHKQDASVGLGAVQSSPVYVSQENNTIDTTKLEQDVFRLSTNNALFDSGVRSGRFEDPRFLGSVIAIPGNMSYLEYDETDRLVVKSPSGQNYYGKHIHLTDINVDLNRNSPGDELKLAFSVINKAASYTGVPAGARILVEFSSDDSSQPENYARFEADVFGTDLVENRYHFVTKKISELVKSSGFSWNSVTLVKIYVTVLETVTGVTAPTDNFYVCLDAFRLENISSENPVYGMTGYSVVRTTDGQPVLKESNTTNMVEFRFGLGVN